jgi:hypothetical protein
MKQFGRSFALARHRLWQAKESLTRYRRLQAAASRRLGYEVNLREPRSFNEKVIWKKLWDRNPLLPVTADKVFVRDYVRQRLGTPLAAQVLIPTLAVTDDPETINFDLLPSSYVIKANHASGTNLLVRDDSRSRADIGAIAAKWLNLDYGWYQHEWAYRHIPRRILVEALIEDSAGQLPDDYKFYMFHGACRYVQHITGRFGAGRNMAFYTPEWDHLEITRGRASLGIPVTRPATLDHMLQIATMLAAEFDFVRVDLYSVDDRVLFGELTHYPASGMSPFKPESFDFQLGSLWTIRPDYWRAEHTAGTAIEVM